MEWETFFDIVGDGVSRRPVSRQAEGASQGSRKQGEFLAALGHVRTSCSRHVQQHSRTLDTRANHLGIQTVNGETRPQEFAALLSTCQRF